MMLEIRLRACIEGKYAQFFLDRDEQIRVLAALSQPQPVAQGEAVAWPKKMLDRADGSHVYGSGYKAALKDAAEYLATTPTGHRVVPVEPTEAMIDAGSDRCTNECRYGDASASIYKAMLAAAPDAGGV